VDKQGGSSGCVSPGGESHDSNRRCPPAATCSCSGLKAEARLISAELLQLRINACKAFGFGPCGLYEADVLSDISLLSTLGLLSQ
jgi:hypothetical protein